MKLRGLKVLTVSAIAAGSMAYAQTPPLAAEVDSSGNGPYSDGTEYIIGWTFTVNSPISVYGLGIWDSGLDGLTQNLEVGIYDASNVLVAFTTVGAGVSPDIGLVDEFQFQSITPVDLLPGSYTIASTTWNGIAGAPEEWTYEAVTSWAPQITYGQSVFDTGFNLFAPPYFYTGLGDFAIDDMWGPNFLFEPVEVPEPSTWIAGLFLTASLCGVVWRRRSAHKRVQ